jgi:hypothetical protein
VAVQAEPVRVLSRISPEPVIARRCGNVVCWDFPRHKPTADDPHRIWIERSYLLLDVGVQLKLPHWWADEHPGVWYVDLVQIVDDGDVLRVRDLYLDVIVPTDGRPYRMLDAEEFGDAIEAGELSVADAVDGLRRWQLFLDTYLHIRGQLSIDPIWRDFPPACLREFD